MKRRTLVGILTLILIIVVYCIYNVIRRGEETQITFPHMPQQPLAGIAKRAPKLQSIPREIISLNGTWEIARGKATPPTSGWKSIEVPSFITVYDYPFSAWFRKKFYLPKIPKDNKVFIRFYGVKYHCIVYVNNKRVGEHWDGFSPFIVDITDVVKQESENTLLIFVEDWRSMLSGVKKEKVSDVFQVNNAILYPIGSRYRDYGIWDTVELLIVPKVWVYDVFIQTSVRQGNVKVIIEIRNDDIYKRSVVIVNRIYDGTKMIKELPNVTLTISPNSIATAETSSEWIPKRLWSPDDPYLYVLETIITDENGTIIDRKTTRFGFREFWIEGDKFYLNGIRIILRATGCHPWNDPSLFDKEQVREFLEKLKRHNIIAIRYHAQPWPKLWYDTADEVGILVIHESAVWCYGYMYKLDDNRFWDNFKKHLIAQIRLHRNNPSVVIWSLENELLLTGGTRTPMTKLKLAELAEAVRKVDPTRPIMFEGDEDPLKAADIINLHYPHEYPKWDDYPNTAYWLDKPVVLDSYPRKLWIWRRDKPLYIGEFLWIEPSSHDIAAAVLGEDAYKSFWEYYRKAKGFVWKMQIEAYRYYRVSGFCPWSTVEDHILWNVTKEAYTPIAAFVKEYDSRFFGGSKILRTVIIYNDILQKSHLIFKWKLIYGNGTIVQEDEEEFYLDPGDAKKYLVELNLPRLSKPTLVYFVLTLYRDTELVFNDTKTYWIYPMDSIDPSLVTLRIGLYDPLGFTKKIYDSIGIRYEALSDLSDLESIDVLVIGYHAIMSSDDLKEYLDEILDFVKNGGTLIFYEQRHIPNWLPVRLKITTHNSTITFMTLPPHSILNGITQDDLKFWHGDHIVSKFDIAKPLHGNFRPIVISGYGLRYSPALEIYYGRGRILICQLVITEKYGKDPIATRIYHNIIRYYMTVKREYVIKKALVVTADNSTLKKALDIIGISYSEATDTIEEINLEMYDLVIIDADILTRFSKADYEKLMSFLTKGGHVIIHGITRRTVSFLEELNVSALIRKSYSVPPILVRRTDITAGMSNDIFHWVAKVTGKVIQREELSTEIVSNVLVPPYYKGDLVHEIYPKDMNVVCPAYGKTKEVIGLYTNGYAEFSVYFNESGTYILSIMARGTPAEGGYPIMEVRMDDNKIDAVMVSTETFSSYDLIIDVKKGKHSISIAFINDLYKPEKGEDRNLYIGKVSIFKAKIKELSFIPLVNPTILAMKEVGKGLLIIDQVPWPSVICGKIKTGSLDKTLRYVSILMTNLGVQINTENCIIMSASDMSIREVGAYRIFGDEVQMYSNGYIGDYIEFPKAGTYKLLLLTRGTPALNEYPIIEVRIDKNTVAKVNIESDEWRVYSTEIRVPSPGRHRLEIAFINDYYTVTEDRNLYLRLIMLSYEG